jgi:hypothetical protein
VKFWEEVKFRKIFGEPLKGIDREKIKEKHLKPSDL